MSQNDYESERIASREAIAAALSGVADGLLTGTIQLGEGADAVTVDAPAEAALEIELETDGDESSLELELEWPVDGESDTVTAPDEVADDEDVDAVPVPVGAADGSQSLARFEVYEDNAGEWRWRLRHRNGNIIATSGEGYTRKHNAWKGLRSVMSNSPNAAVTEESSD